MITQGSLKQILTHETISMRIKQADEMLHHYKARIYNLWCRSDALKNEYSGHEDDAFNKYIDTVAILYYRELQDCGVDFPSWQDMITVGGETDLRLFLQIGRSCYEDIVKYIPSNRSLRILDFGVGCGRTARHFYQDLKRCEVHGCDVDATPIEYLYNNVPFIQPLLSSNEPPLPYESGYFDVIYSVSVFSHLKQSAFYAWAEELSRVLRRGGLLVITIHGVHALNITSNKDDVGSIGINKTDFESESAILDQDGFIWMPQETSSPDIDTSQYGISFVDKNRLASHLPPTLKVVHYGEGEIGNWQDLVVLEKV